MEVGDSEEDGPPRPPPSSSESGLNSPGNEGASPPPPSSSLQQHLEQGSRLVLKSDRKVLTSFAVELVHITLGREGGSRIYTFEKANQTINFVSLVH